MGLSPEDIQWLQNQRAQQMQRQQMRQQRQQRPQQGQGQYRAMPYRPPQGANAGYRPPQQGLQPGQAGYRPPQQYGGMNPSNSMGEPLPGRYQGPTPTGDENMRTMEWNPQKDWQRRQPGYDPYQDRLRQSTMDQQYRAAQRQFPQQRSVGGAMQGGVGSQMGSPGQPPTQNWALEGGMGGRQQQYQDMMGKMQTQMQQEQQRAQGGVGAGQASRARPKPKAKAPAKPAPRAKKK